MSAAKGELAISAAVGGASLRGACRGAVLARPSFEPEDELRAALLRLGIKGHTSIGPGIT
jgi:hypothetical protein